jgi:hypothetical protein
MANGHTVRRTRNKGRESVVMVNDRQATELQQTGKTQVANQTLAEIIELVGTLGIDPGDLVLTSLNQTVTLEVIR